MLSHATRPAAVVAGPWRTERLADGRWRARSPAAPGCPLLAEVQLWGLCASELAAARERLAAALPALRELATALGHRQFAAVAAPLAALAASAEALREGLLASHLQDPGHLPTQRALGLVSLVAGRAGEACFHLLRAVPGQYHMFAVGNRLTQLRAHPDAPPAVLLAAAAMEWLGRADAARTLLACLREQLDVMRLAATCQAFPPHVLWRHPEVLRHVRGVLQVGANVGDELPCWGALGLRHLVAFEPVPAAFGQLEQAIVRHRPAGAVWSARPLAVGDHVGGLPFWVGEQTGNSSFLPLHPDRSPFHQQNRHAHRIEVATTTLDAWAAAEPAAAAPCNLLFLDVQGTEHLVLAGGRALLAQMDFVVLELSETEIYAGSWTAEPMVALLAGLGFVELDRGSSGFPEQFDALFVRPGRHDGGHDGRR